MSKSDLFNQYIITLCTSCLIPDYYYDYRFFYSLFKTQEFKGDRDVLRKVLEIVGEDGLLRWFLSTFVGFDVHFNEFWLFS